MASPPPIDFTEESPGFLLWQVAHQWQRRMTAALKPLDLNHVQFILLASLERLAEGTEFVAQVDLASHAKTDAMMTSKVARKLEQKGLLTRTTNPSDNRVKLLNLTPAGKRKLAKAKKHVLAVDHGFFEANNHPPAEVLMQLRELQAAQPGKASVSESAAAQ